MTPLSEDYTFRTFVKLMRAWEPNFTITHSDDGNGRVTGTPPDRSRSIPWEQTMPMVPVPVREKGKK